MAPGIELPSPGGQVAHFDEPLVLEYDPGAQSEHGAPSTEKEPGGQPVHNAKGSPSWRVKPF